MMVSIKTEPCDNERGTSMVTSVNPQSLAASQDQVIQACRRLVEGNVLSLSHHGNVSVRVPDSESFVLTGGGTLDDMSTEHLAHLDLEGNLLSGSLGPASHEIVQMHAAVYRKRADLGAVIHTHSPNVTAYAIASKPIPPVYEAMIRFDLLEPVPVADYGPRGSQRSVQNIIDVVGPKTKAVLLANHGILVFDTDIDKAAHLVFVLEEAAEFTMKADTLGGAKPIPAELFSEALARRDEFEQTGTVAHGDGE